MKTIKKAILGLLSVFLFMSCNKDNNQEDFIETVPYNSIEDFFKANEVKAQDFTLNATKGGTIKGKDGTEVTFEANSFVNANGDIVTGTVIVELKEIFKASDMVLSNKPTNALSVLGEKTFLISEGETEVQVKQNGTKVALVDGKKISISVPASGSQDESMQAFVGNPKGVQGATGTMIWTLAKPRVTFVPSNTTLNTTNKYLYDAFSTGWRNCDKFYNYAGDKTTNSVNLTNSPNKKETMLFIVFKDNNRPAVVRYITNYTNGLKSYNNMMPVGLEVTFVAISISENKQYLATKTHTIGVDEELMLEFNLTTSEEIQNTLNALN